MSSSLQNRLLASLSSENRARLLALSTPVDLPVRTALFEPDVTPRYAYFMTSGIASLVVGLADGASTEVGLVGKEGLVGGLHLIGPAALASHCFIQIAGTGLRIPFTELKKVFSDSEEIRGRILEYIQYQNVVVMQVAACNKLHESEARLARWLLMVQDRTGQDVLALTQEFLAQMLGAQRTTVAVSAGTLQKAGLIEYSRGKVRILDRERFLEAACNCYEVTRKPLESLYQQL